MTCVRKSNAGMSLLELTFAAGVLAMALSLLFGSLMSIALVARINSDKAMANTILSGVLDDVRGMSLDDLKSYEAPTLEQLGVNRVVSLAFFDAKGAEIPLPLKEEDESLEDEDLPNPLEVVAMLLWTDEKGHVFHTRAAMLVAR